MQETSRAITVTLVRGSQPSTRWTHSSPGIQYSSTRYNWSFVILLQALKSELCNDEPWCHRNQFLARFRTLYLCLLFLSLGACVLGTCRNSLTAIAKFYVGLYMKNDSLPTFQAHNFASCIIFGEMKMTATILKHSRHSY